jgi:hypothetical protein
MRHGQFIEVLLLTLVLVSAALAVGTRGRELWIGGLLCVATLGGEMVTSFLPAFDSGMGVSRRAPRDCKVKWGRRDWWESPSASPSPSPSLPLLSIRDWSVARRDSEG